MNIDITSYDYIKIVDGIKLYSSVDLSKDEAEYICRRQCARVKVTPDFIVVDVHGDWLVAAPFFTDPRKFERIRRITGYLVGTLDRFNDGKRAEEAERVKHSVRDN